MSPDRLPHGTVAAEQIWKRYRPDASRPPLRDALARAVGRPRRQANWVLRGVDLRIEPGDSVGLVGLNGSGKSTLLKTVAGVTFPTAGRLGVGGRVGALLEVRAGIHPELSGRENTFFYGTVLGLSRKQVAARFDEIVQFGELEGAIDRQVKYYSSGMQMRLGFSIAAFLEPDVLLVDEALAVGDVGFQQRCLERMRTVLSQGTTLVFVSHDMAAVETMCRRALWLDAGVVRSEGPTADVLADYRVGLEEKAAQLATFIHGPVRLRELALSGGDGGTPMTGESLDITLTLSSESAVLAEICLGVSEGPANPIFALTRSVELRDGENTLQVRVDNVPLPRGRYYVWLGAFAPGNRVQMPWHPAAPLDVAGPQRKAPPRGVMLLSPVHVTAEWNTVALPGPASGTGTDDPSTLGS